METVIINVGGCRHVLRLVDMKRSPRSRLGHLANQIEASEDVLDLCDDVTFDHAENKMEYFFDRHPVTSSNIMNFYRTGKLHCVEEVCVQSFNDDLDYWGIEDCQLEPCCQFHYTKIKEISTEEIRKELKCLKLYAKEEDFSRSTCCVRWRKKVWEVMEKPQTSVTARVIALISVSIIILSTISLTLNTMPALKVKNCNGTITGDNEHLASIEAICIGWFTVEYVIRLLASPDKCRFLRSVLNCIDLAAMTPFYASFFFNESKIKGGQLQTARRLVQVFRIMRIFRVFKLARHSVGLQSLGYTLRRSYKELGLLITFISIGILIFSSLAYFAEKTDEDQLVKEAADKSTEHPIPLPHQTTSRHHFNQRHLNQNQFTSIPDTFWWAAITMTTVGYGDVYPTTYWGKLVGAMCCVCGVLVIALPIPIIVSNFSEFYRDQMRLQRALKRLNALDKAFSSGSIAFTNETVLGANEEQSQYDSPVIANVDINASDKTTKEKY